MLCKITVLKGKNKEKGTKERVCGEKGLVLLQCFI